LYRDPGLAHLSAIISSNAAMLGKFNRMGFLAGWRPPGLRMTRRGLLFDRTPGALEPINFSFVVGSEEYQALWPWGEAWCQELEVFHNPLQLTRSHSISSLEQHTGLKAMAKLSAIPFGPTQSCPR
jgi:hypothetical protein